MLLREDQLSRALTDKSGRLKGVLIYGSDSAAVSELARLSSSERAKHVTPSVVMRFDATVLKTDSARLASEYSAISLLGERTVVIVPGCDDAAAPSVRALLDVPVTENFIILTADVLKKSSKLRLACEAASDFGCLPVYEETESSQRARISAYFAKESMTMSRGAADLFMECVGRDRSLALREAEKLAVYCRAQSVIQEEDVRAACGNVAAYAIEELCDAVISGSAAEVDRIYTTIERDPGQSGVALMQVMFQLQRLQSIRFDMEHGLAPKPAMQRAKPPVFFKREAVIGSQLRKLDLSIFESMIRLLAQAIAQTRACAALGDEIAGNTLFQLAGLALKQR